MQKQVVMAGMPAHSRAIGLHEISNSANGFHISGLSAASLQCGHVQFCSVPNALKEADIVYVGLFQGLGHRPILDVPSLQIADDNHGYVDALCGIGDLINTDGSRMRRSPARTTCFCM